MKNFYWFGDFGIDFCVKLINCWFKILVFDNEVVDFIDICGFGCDELFN